MNARENAVDLFEELVTNLWYGTFNDTLSYSDLTPFAEAVAGMVVCLDKWDEDVEHATGVYRDMLESVREQGLAEFHIEEIERLEG